MVKKGEESIEKVAAAIQAQLFKKANTQTLGLLRSHFKGAGLQFREHQIYNPGDDVRFIDWKLSAKSHKTYIKTFEEDHSLEVIIYIPVDAQMSIGYFKKSKLQVALELTYLTYLLMSKAGDKVKTFLVLEREIVEVPPSSGKVGLMKLLKVLGQNKLMLMKQESGVKASIQDFHVERSSLNWFISDKTMHKLVANMKKHLAKNKEVLFFAPSYHFHKDIEGFRKRKNFHYFFMRSPMDKGSISRFGLWSYSGKAQGTTGFQVISNQKENVSASDGKSTNVLDVDENYLEQFAQTLTRST